MTEKHNPSKAVREILADLEKRDDRIGQMVREVKADAKAQAAAEDEDQER